MYNLFCYRWTWKPRPGLPSSSGESIPTVSGKCERKFIFNLVIPRRYRLGTRINITTPASSRGVITESWKDCCKQSDTEQFKLFVGHNGCKSACGAGNHVHALHSDFVVACQPLRALYTRA